MGTESLYEGEWNKQNRIAVGGRVITLGSNGKPNPIRIDHLNDPNVGKGGTSSNLRSGEEALDVGINTANIIQPNLDYPDPTPEPVPAQLIMSFDTEQAGSPNDTFILPLLKQVDDPTVNYNFTYEVKDSGGAVVDSGVHTTDADLTISGLTAGVYSIEITAEDGDFGCIRFNNGGDKEKVTELSQWGTLQWNNQLAEASTLDAFEGCSSLELTATDKPNFNCLNLRNFFSYCPNLAGGASSFGISGYDLSASYTCRSFFWGAIPSVDTIDLTNVKFCVGGTDYHRGMTSFIGVASVQAYTTVDMTGADTSGAISAKNLFLGADNLSSVIGLADLDFSSCVRFDGMFRAWASPSPLLFDVDMSNWNLDVSAGSFDGMFRNRTFDGTHYVSGIENVTPANLLDGCFRNFMVHGARLTTASYDALLIKLASYIGSYTITDKNMQMGGSQYTGGGAAEAARDALVVDGWIISDGGSV